MTKEAVGEEKTPKGTTLSGRWLSMAGALLALAMAAHVWRAQAATAVVRAIGDMRTWSILPDASTPLTWRWSEGATAATLAASNVVSGVAAVSAAIAREGACDASCAIPLAGPGLFDVTLRETAGDVVVFAKTVRLKVGQCDDTVALDRADAAFRVLDEPRIYSWDAAWFAPSAETVSLATADKSGASLGAWELPGTSGYDVLRRTVHFAGRSGRVVTALALDGEEVAAANLYLPSGFMMYLR